MHINKVSPVTNCGEFFLSSRLLCFSALTKVTEKFMCLMCGEFNTGSRYHAAW